MAPNQIKNALIVMALWAFWSGVCFVGKYGKPWLGHRQEIYPTLILPGFLRNSAKTARDEFTTRRVAMETANGSVIHAAPDAHLGYFGWFVVGQLLDRDSADVASSGRQWMQAFPDSVARVTFLEETFVFESPPPSGQKVLVGQRQKTYELKK